MSTTDRPDQTRDDRSSAKLASQLKARRASFGGRVENLARSVEADGVRPAGPIDTAVDGSDDRVDVALLYSGRTPVEIHDGYVGVGRVRVPFYSVHIDDVLAAYLNLVGRLRGNPEGPVVSIRRVDIDALAVHFGWAGDQVVNQLAVAVGASKPRTQSMLKSYALGASVINSGSSNQDADKDQKTNTPSRLRQMLLDG